MVVCGPWGLQSPLKWDRPRCCSQGPGTRCSEPVQRPQRPGLLSFSGFIPCKHLTPQGAEGGTWEAPGARLSPTAAQGPGLMWDAGPRKTAGCMQTRRYSCSPHLQEPGSPPDPVLPRSLGKGPLAPLNLPCTAVSKHPSLQPSPRLVCTQLMNWGGG